MNLSRKFLISFVFLFLCSGAASGLELIYPEDGTFVVKSDYLIIKGGDKPLLDAVTIEINGLKSGLIDISSPEYRAVFTDFLILEPEFEPGENIVTVEGFVQGEFKLETTASIYFQKDPNAHPPANYRPYVMHTPQREALCSPCHNMNPTNNEMKMSSAEKNPCASCHKKILAKKNVHGPAGVFRCVFCHDPSSSPVKYKSKGGDANVCNECHLDKLKEFNEKSFIHGPVQVGLCSVCHNAHASDYPAQSLAPINDVCLGCHEKLKLGSHVVRGVAGNPHPLRGQPDPSRTGRQMSCTSCHNPHGGANEVYFDKSAAASQMMLCQKCHRK